MLLGVGSERQVVGAGRIFVGAEHPVVVALGGQLIDAIDAVGRSLVVVLLGFDDHILLGERPDSRIVSILNHGPAVGGVEVLLFGLEAEEVADDGHALDDKLVSLLKCSVGLHKFLDGLTDGNDVGLLSSHSCHSSGESSFKLFSLVLNSLNLSNELLRSYQECVGGNLQFLNHKEVVGSFDSSLRLCQCGIKCLIVNGLGIAFNLT